MTDAALLEEFNTEAEAEKNETRGALGGAGHIGAETRLGVIPKDQRANFRKAAALCKRAIKQSDDGDHVGAAKHALKALDISPDTALPNHTVGLLLFRIGRFSKALGFYERAWKLDPNDDEIYLNMGIVAWKLDMLEAAEKFYRLCVQVNPDSINGLINLASVLRDQGKFEDAIELLREKIYLHQGNPDLWNSLGTVLAESGDPVGSVPFYTEALRLKPDFARAHHNLANMFELTGEPDKAVEHFEEALRNPQDKIDRATMRHGLSMALLASGRLTEGWQAYQVRLDPDNTQAALFAMRCPRWESLDLDELKGKTVTIVGEQGLGDEILFLNAGNELLESIGPDGELRIACEKRLIPLITRSFPTARVDHHVSTVLEGRNIRAGNGLDVGADFWAPMGDPLGALRPSIESFPDKPAFMTADPVRVEEYRAELAELGNGVKAGILWKSLKMNASRSRFFSPLDHWKPVLQTPGVTFVNMQYGDLSDDLVKVRDEFGVDIYTPRNLDLLNDLDGVAAMGVALDMTIGPMNAAMNLAGACGGEIWIFSSNRRNWTTFSADCLPWYPNSQYFWGDGFADWSGIMAKIARALAARTAA